MRDETHLSALLFGLSNERVRLAAAKSDGERALRSVWVAQLEKEVSFEESFLAARAEMPPMTDDELMAELMA